MGAYNVKGHKIRDKQLFLRTYRFPFGEFTAKYFIDNGVIHSVDSETGHSRRVKFKMAQLTGPPTIHIEVLDEFYKLKGDEQAS